MARRAILKNHVSTLTLVLIAGLGEAAVPAYAACTTDASGNATCVGVTNTPLTIYDPAAQYQPINGSNAYTPPSYNQNPPTVTVTIQQGATVSATGNTTAAFADRGVIVANYTNAENPAVNNVVVNNFGTVAATTGQTATTRVSAIVSDSQVNTFTVNNMSTGTISATQAYFTTAGFNPALLSTTASGTPPTYAARYNGAALNIVSALYSDDNTNSFIVNNSGVIVATGRFAAAYYGRADTTITNNGLLGNTDWKATDQIYDGHWSIATFAGANFATVAGSNPDVPLYDVQNITTNAQGYKQGTLQVVGTSATTITNNAGATIDGDILALDTNPLVTAAAAAKGQALPLASSGTNSGPRDSNIKNLGTINGNFYLGSGTHVIDNAAGALLNGSVNVDQRASIGVFATGVPGTVPGTYQSAGPATASSTGAACPAAGANTTDPYCAKTTNVLASFAGGQSLTFTNEGTMTGDIRIIDQATSVNTIGLTGSGFTGNIVAVNGLGTNSLVLNNVTSLTSVSGFTFLDLMQSNVAVTNGVTLVTNSANPTTQINTTIFGPGGTTTAPTTNLGSIQGTLTLNGAATNITPTFAAIAHDGDVYELATTVNGTGVGAITATSTYLVTVTPSVQNGSLLLTTSVMDAAAVPGITTPAGQTLNGLLDYMGTSAAVQTLGAAVENLQTADQVRTAGAALSPIVNGADIQAPINATMSFHQQVDTRLDQFMFAQIPSSGRSADLGPAHPVPVYGVLPPNGAWIEGLGGGLHQGTVNGVNGYTAEFEGVLAGYDRLIVPGLRVGAAFGYVDTRVNGQNNLSTREGIQTYQGLGYAEFAQDHYYLRGSAGYGGVNYNSTRQIDFLGFTDTAFGQHNGNILTVRGEGGVPYEIAGNLVVPYAAFTYGHLTQDAYSETSSNGAAFSFGAATNDSERSEVGGKIIIPLTTMPVFSTLFPVATSTVALEGRAAYIHEFGNVGQTVNVAFAGGNPFIVSGPVPNRDMVDFGVGLRMGSGPVQFDISYNGLARSTFYDQYGLLRARYVF